MTVPAAPAHSLPRLLFALAAMTSVEFLENGMVMFCATQIIEGLRLSTQDFVMAQTLYGVAAIVMLYKHQWVVERLGYRRFAGWSLAVFGLGSLLCAVAGGAATFLLGRTLQGLAGATFFTAGRMAVSELPLAHRTLGMKTFICSLLGATAVAPLVSAMILETFGWRGIFAVGILQAVGVGIVSVACLSNRKAPRAQRSRSHWIWVGLMVAGVFALQFAVVAAGSQTVRWPQLLGVMAAGVALLAVFVWRQVVNDRPLINYRALAQPRYLTGLALYACGYFLAGTTGMLVPVLLHVGLGLPIVPTAAIATVGLLVSLGMAMVHLRLSARWPRPQPFMLAALLLFALASVMLAVPREAGLPVVVGVTLVLGIAVSLYMGPVAMGTFSELAEKDFSHAYQVKNIVRQIGLSSSMALSTLALHALARPGGVAASGQALELASASVIDASRTILVVVALLTLPLAVLVLRQRVFR